MNLYLHLTPDDLTGDGTGAVSIEQLGAATTHLLTDWLARHTGKVLVRPVLDLAVDWAVDQHDPPERMREQVILRDAHCVFPGCTRDSRACDLDHITAYIPLDEGGPPGQTRPVEPRAPVPHPSPHQDPHHLGLQTPRRSRLHLDQPHRPPVRHPPHLPPATGAKNLTPRTPATKPRPGPQARPPPALELTPPRIGDGHALLNHGCRNHNGREAAQRARRRRRERHRNHTRTPTTPIDN